MTIILPFDRFLELCVFPYLKRCPKLKLVKITNIFVNMDSDFYEVLGSLLVNFNSASLKELHWKFLTLCMEVLDSAPFLQAVKNFLKKVTENKPKLQYLGLYLNLNEVNAGFTPPRPRYGQCKENLSRNCFWKES